MQTSGSDSREDSATTIDRYIHEVAALPAVPPEEEARLHEIFLISTRYEWLFWEMAWRLEEWPV